MNNSHRVAVAVGIFLGLLLGMLVTGVMIGAAGQRFMLKEMRSPYDMERTVRTIENRINNHEGWHVVTTYDQDAEIQHHGGEAIGPMKIIVYCHGEFASRMLKPDDQKIMGAMMPKRFAVYEKSDGSVWVGTANGAVIGKLLGGDIGLLIEEVALEVEDIMRFMNFKFTVF